MNPWLQTYTGKVVEFPVTPDMFDVRDIAHSLAAQCRYTGHTRTHYSVAEHSCLLAEYFRKRGEPEFARYALVHDAAEAYVVDLPRPLKVLLPEYKKLIEPVEAELLNWFGLLCALPLPVVDADIRICLDERNQNMGPPPKDWEIPGPPLGVKLHCWNQMTAKAAWLNQYKFLFPGHSGGA